MAVKEAEINALEKLLKQSLYRKSKQEGDEERTLKDAFKQFDTDGSGQITLDEFCNAMARFGLQVASEILPGRSSGGVRPEALHALFHRYDADGSGQLDYQEFARGLYHAAGESGAGAKSVALADSRRREEEWGQRNAEAGTNPWLPSLSGSESMDPKYRRPFAANPALRVRSIAGQGPQQ